MKKPDAPKIRSNQLPKRTSNESCKSTKRLSSERISDEMASKSLDKYTSSKPCSTDTNSESNAPNLASITRSSKRATVTKRTRTYTIEGIEMSSTTLHVLGAQQDYELRFL